jgi:hypothetical protein
MINDFVFLMKNYFPITKPSVCSYADFVIGCYEGKKSFNEFKSKLIEFVKLKNFVDGIATFGRY